MRTSFDNFRLSLSNNCSISNEVGVVGVSKTMSQRGCHLNCSTVLVLFVEQCDEAQFKLEHTCFQRLQRGKNQRARIGQREMRRTVQVQPSSCRHRKGIISVLPYLSFTDD